MQYLLGLSSPAEREQIESEYFDDESAFQEMLTAENDLIDAYARGALSDEERRRFEKRFVGSSSGRGRVQFARAFAGAVSATRSVETKLPGTLLDIFKTFQSPGLLRTATIVAAIVFVVILAWLFTDRRRMTNELGELHAEFAELSKRTEALQRSSNSERTRTAEIAVGLADLRTQPDKARHRERATDATQRVRHLPEVKNDREKIASSKSKPEEKFINTQDASLGNAFDRRKITELALNASNVANLLTLQPTRTRDGNVARGRADQANVTLDGVSVEPLNSYSLMPRNMSSSGTTTVRGTVKDANGNVVRGATVTLTDPARNFTRTQSTNEDGTYVLNAIPPGTYSLKVTALGFKTASALGLAALVDSSTLIDVQLELGSISETVNVTSAAEVIINTNDASLPNSFEGKRITQLPPNANNVVGRLSLQPGVSRTGFENGVGADQPNITLDGVDATIRIPNSLSWIRFQIAFETAAIHEDYRVTIKTADGRSVTPEHWGEPLTSNQTIIDTPTISTGDLPSGHYVLLLMGKEPDGSFVKVAEYSFKVIKY